MLSKFKKRKLINCFFFLRYFDNDGAHIRLRFRCNDKRLLHDIVTTVSMQLKSLVDLRAIHKIQIDTYIREIERFPSKHYPEIEKLFYYNSLDFIYHVIPEKVKNPFKIYSKIEALSKLYHADEYERHRFFEDLFNLFLKRMNLNKKAFLTDVKSYAYRNLSEINNELKLPEVSRYEKQQMNLLISLKPQLSEDIFKCLIQDLIHLAINRFSIKSPNENEVTIYYILSKSLLILSKQKNNGKS